MNVAQLIVEDFRTQREGLFAQASWALLVHRFSHLRMSCRFRLVRAPWWLMNVVLQKLVEMLCGMTIPESAVIGRRLRIEHFGPVVIHGNARIGDDCLLRQSVTIGNRGDADPTGAPVLGNRVEVGAGAVIIGRIHIGDDARVGANAVVTRDVPAGITVVGIPARPIRSGHD
ncbi:MAG: serine acetyltransferase [Burkholderiales bacterium PBB6]|nr:MAG: serine acetyltransferase [Burkholderiales bacterium PBB6]